MKTLPSGMQAHLDTGATTLAMCWKIERADGEVFGFTEHDRPLTFGGVTYEADTAFQRTQISQSLGVAVDNHDVMGAVSSDTLDPDDIAAGIWDGAEVTVSLVNWSDTAMRQILYRGQIGRMARGELAFRAEVRSLVDRLAQKTGRVFGFYCDADLGDARCGVDLESSAHAATGEIGSSPTARLFTVTDLSGTFDDDWFTGGLCRLTSGDLDGQAREIKAHSVSGSTVTLELWEALPAVPGEGDTLALTAGCNKTWDTCRAKFSNGDNFRGFPHMPGNDRVTDYPRQGETMDGGSLFNSGS